MLKQELEERGHLHVQDAGTVSSGMHLALTQASPSDHICVFGSLYQIGDVYAYFDEEHI